MGEGIFFRLESSVIAGLAGDDTVLWIQGGKDNLVQRVEKNGIMAGVGCGQSGVYPGGGVWPMCGVVCVGCGLCVVWPV